MAYLLCLSLLTVFTAAESSFSPARPPSLPLAVRNPYLSTWQPAGSDGGNGGYLAGEWARFYQGQITGWAGLIRVDGTTYTWLGDPAPLPEVVNQTAFTYTATRSTFAFDAGPVSMNVTFLSPVTPNDETSQSYPITYIDVQMQSADGNEHDVQLYTDVSAEWASGDRSAIAEWTYGTTEGNSSAAGKRSAPVGREVRRSLGEGSHRWQPRKLQAPSTYSSSMSATSTSSAKSTATGTTPVGDGVAYHKFWKQTQQEFAEVNQQASWGYWYYATQDVEGLTHQSGADTDVRGLFTDTGVLNNTADTDYRAINDAYPVFGFAVDFGSVGAETVGSLFTISLAQENVIQFANGDGIQSLPAYWTSTYSDEIAALAHFYNDYETAAGIATALDNKIESDSTAAGGSDYNILTSLACRQAFGALQVAGTPDASYIFLKEISSDSDIQTVDVIFPFMPIIVYLNPSWLRKLLDPIFIYTEAGLFTQGDYALHDLGIFPNATKAGSEKQQLEESGNMLIMTLAYAQRTNDTTYLNDHYDTLNGWTQYLINDSLTPDNQISTDDFAGSLANQTNLALKGMIGIQAMSTIANMTGHTDDGANYSSIAHDYISQWQNLGIAQDANPPHTTLNYSANATWGILYNLYSDALLQTNLVPTSVYEMQSNYYPTVDHTYGVPLDTRHNYTKNDWEIWAAAIADTNTTSMFISQIAQFINETPTSKPVTDLYDTDDADFANGVTFYARPVVGGWFALLALGDKVGIPDR